jgi:N-acetylglutamate synthase/N-acetylornithine aminotransferase
VRAIIVNSGNANAATESWDPGGAHDAETLALRIGCKK